MRNKNKAFLSCAIVAALALLASPAAMATGSSCPPLGTPVVVAGPCPVASLTSPACATSGAYTGIEYEIPGALSSDYVTTLVTVNNTVPSNNVATFPVGSTLQPLCTAANGGGDLTTDLGEYSCHEQALRVKIGTVTILNPDGVTTRTGQGFWLLVKGNKQPLQTSIAQKRGFCAIKSTAILGLGLDFAAAATVTETLTHVNTDNNTTCSVEFTLDSAGANVLSAKVVPGSSANCRLRIDNAADIEVTFPGSNTVHPMKFGQGYFESGLHSCTTRIIGGRVYSWGDPCPD